MYKVGHSRTINTNPYHVCTAMITIREVMTDKIRHIGTRKGVLMVLLKRLLPGRTSTPIISILQMGQVIDGTSNHRLMHSPWNQCLHRGSTHSSSPLTNSSMQMMQLSMTVWGTTAETEVDGGGAGEEEEEGTT